MKYFLYNKVQICLFLFITLFLFGQCTFLTSKETSSVKNVMFDSSNIKPLLDFYSIGSLQPHSSAGRLIVDEKTLNQWKKLEVSLSKIVTKQNNPRAVDALLLLSCGKWLYDKDANKAIELSNIVVQEHSTKPTILSINMYDWICPLRLDLNWHFYLREYIDGTLSANENISKRKYHSKLERKAYVSHLLKYPFHADDVASILIAFIANTKKDNAIVERSLKRVLEKHSFENMKEAALKDIKACAEPYGSSLVRLRRPEIIATMFLATHYSSNNKMAEASSLAEKLANAVSNKGFYHDINMFAGNLLKNISKTKAEHQFRVALEGYNSEICRMVKNTTPSSIDKLPISFWSKKVIEIKKAILSVGGNINIDAKEVEAIRKRILKPKDMDIDIKNATELHDCLKRIHSREGSHSVAEYRMKGLIKLSNTIKKNLLNKTQKEVLITPQIIHMMILGIFHIAITEKDPNVQKKMIALANEYIQKKYKKQPKSIDDADKAKVEKIIAQFSGENIDAPSTYPGTDLADMNRLSLIYASELAQKKNISIEAKRHIAKALSNSGNPVLYDFFINLIISSTDSKLNRYAMRGLEHIVKECDINEKGKIILK